MFLCCTKGTNNEEALGSEGLWHDSGYIHEREQRCMSSSRIVSFYIVNKQVPKVTECFYSSCSLSCSLCVCLVNVRTSTVCANPSVASCWALYLSIIFKIYTFSVCCRIMTGFGKTLASTWNWVALKIVKITSVLLHCFDFSLPKVWMSWSAWTSMLKTWNLNRRISIIWLLTVWQVLRTHPSWRDFLRRTLK